MILILVKLIAARRSREKCIPLLAERTARHLEIAYPSRFENFRVGP